MANELLKALLIKYYGLSGDLLVQVLAQLDMSSTEREIRRVIRNTEADNALHSRR